MPTAPNEYAVHLLLESGREEVRFLTIQEFQKWYSGELVQKSTSNDPSGMPPACGGASAVGLRRVSRRRQLALETLLQRWTHFISVPMKNIQGEYMVVRPSRIVAIRVEPIFSSSVEKFG